MSVSTEALTTLLQRARRGLKKYTRMKHEKIDRASIEEIFNWIKKLESEKVGGTFARTILTGLAEMAIEGLGYEAGKVWMEYAKDFLSSCGIILNSDRDQIEVLTKLQEIYGLGSNPTQRQEAKNLMDQYESLFGKVL